MDAQGSEAGPVTWQQRVLLVAVWSPEPLALCPFAFPSLPFPPNNPLPKPLHAFLEGLFKGSYQAVGGHSGTDTKAAAGPSLPVNGG